MAKWTGQIVDVIVVVASLSMTTATGKQTLVFHQQTTTDEGLRTNGDWPALRRSLINEEGVRLI